MRRRFYFKQLIRFLISCYMQEGQCDQLARLFFNLWPFAAMKICPIALQIWQSWLKLCQIDKMFLNFAKYGHTNENGTFDYNGSYWSYDPYRQINWMSCVVGVSLVCTSTICSMELFCKRSCITKLRHMYL